MSKSENPKGYIVNISVLETRGWINKLYDTETGEAIISMVKLPVRQLLVNSLFHPSLQISQNNGGILARRIADRILDAKKDSVTLNEDEWKNLKDAISNYPGFAHYEMAVVDRVLLAKETTLKSEK